MKEKNTNKSKDNSNKNASFHPTMKADDRIDTDPQGSWTGTPNDINELPVQDVDDL